MRLLLSSSLLILGSALGVFVACESTETPTLPVGNTPSDAPEGQSDNECVGTQCREGGSFGIGALDGGGGAGGASSEQLAAGNIPRAYQCPGEEELPSPSQDLSPEEAPGASLKFHTNQVGYELEGSKRAVVESTAPLSKFQILREDDEQVLFEGEFVSVPDFIEWNSTAEHLVANFSEMRAEGTFVLRANGESSEPFTVGRAELFSRTAEDVLSFFKNSRADEADASIWEADSAVPFYGGGGSQDVRGGWYDASGDVSKYLSHLSYANFMNPQQIPMTAWVLSWMSQEAEALISSAGMEQDVRAEALFGADYLVRAQHEEGFFVINVFDGWSGSPESREICAFRDSGGQKTADYQAAYREGGGMSIAALARASALGEAGAFTSEEYLAAAVRGFEHLEVHGPEYADDGKENIIDDYTTPH